MNTFQYFCCNTGFPLKPNVLQDYALRITGLVEKKGWDRSINTTLKIKHFWKHLQP